MAFNTKLKPLSDAIHKLATKVSRLDERQKLVFLALVALRGFHHVKLAYHVTKDPALHDFIENTFNETWELIETAIEKGIEFCPESQLEEAGIDVGEFLFGKGDEFGPAPHQAPAALTLCIGICIGCKASRNVIEDLLKSCTLELRLVIDGSKNKMSQEEVKLMEELIENEYCSYLEFYDDAVDFCPKNYSGYLDIDEFHHICDGVAADLYEDSSSDFDDDNTNNI